MIASLFVVSFADDPTDLESWKDGASTEGFNGAVQGAADIGAASDKLLSTIAKILTGLYVLVIGIRWMFVKDAQGKKTTKDMILQILGGATIIYFGTPLLIKILSAFKVFIMGG